MRKTVLAFAIPLAVLALAAGAAADRSHCPPGLAKKAVPCVPPGQVGKQAGRVWHPGDRISGDYILIPRDQWARYGLRPYDDDSDYLLAGNQILRVLRDTLVVIEAVRILSDALD
ncbi:MAG: excinuclease ABC subunit A [Paracoccaceae bacterium]